MKKGTYLVTICSVITLMGILVVSICGHAQTPVQVPAITLEKKLYQAALKEGKLEYWDTLALKEISIFIQEFNKKYPGINVAYFEGTIDVITEKCLAEIKAGRATTDLINVEPYQPFRDQGLLLDLSDIIKDTKYSPQLCTKDLKGVTLEHAVAVAAYNTKLVSPRDVPRKWEDLLDHKWKGKINFEPRFKLWVHGTEHWGEEWIVNYFKKLRGQGLIFTKGATQTLTLLGAGEFPISIGVYLHTILLGQQKGIPVDYIPIPPAIHRGIVPFVVPKMTRHPNAAKLWLYWLMSPEGQALIDKVRFKGNPLPGMDTRQSKILNKYGIPVFSSTEWVLDNEIRLEKIFAEAIGFKN